jgi:beta-glucanase (GH16 family)
MAYDNLFHKYTIEWDANSIVWFIDDVETYKVLRTNSTISATWPFDAEFHLLLNTAVGGNLGGNVSNTSLQTAQYMEIDYVRVYQNQ